MAKCSYKLEDDGEADEYEDEPIVDDVLDINGDDISYDGKRCVS